MRYNNQSYAKAEYLQIRKDIRGGDLLSLRICCCRPLNRTVVTSNRANSLYNSEQYGATLPAISILYYYTTTHHCTKTEIHNKPYRSKLYWGYCFWGTWLVVAVVLSIGASSR